MYVIRLPNLACVPGYVLWTFLTLKSSLPNLLPDMQVMTLNIIMHFSEQVIEYARGKHVLNSFFTVLL